MQPGGPYRFTHVLGGSPVGKAWAAIDEQGRFVTVAVLDANVAAVSGWREAFVGMTNSLAQAADPLPYAYADFSAAAPWVAYSAEVGPGAEKLFRALGVEYTPAPGAASPVSAPPQPVSGVPQPVSGVPHQVSGVPQPVSGVPHVPWAVQVNPVSGQPVSGSPAPVSATPASPAASQGVPAPAAGATALMPVVQPRPSAEVPPNDPFAPQDRRITPSAPRRRRTGLLVGIAALVLVVLAGAGGVFLWSGSDDQEAPPVVASPSGTAGPPALPTSPPQSPGIEPPKGGKWPTQWPKFTERDNVRTLTGLEGLSFPVKVPMDWQCTVAGSADGFVKYNCGMSAADGSTIGGELIVRTCPQPCDEQRQTTMRQAEEAWGARWTRVGQHATYAEALIETDGEQRHGLVVVAYFRSGADGLTDRQLVLRMTAPVQEAQQLRRVATYLRDVVVF
ncbi:hypothetical protein ACGF5C_26735 [Micromonospora sp. NPDC047620]|uniref:hypothetical protein n=1 Tax=Micromonospora sp. NPDC047620 TaxID=3364251 RepID=UPI00371B0BA8